MKAVLGFLELYLYVDSRLRPGQKEDEGRCTMKAVLGFLELYLHDAPDDDDDSLSIDAASYSSRTTTSTSDFSRSPRSNRVLINHQINSLLEISLVFGIKLLVSASVSSRD